MKTRHPEYQYLDLLKDILKNGSEKELFFTPEVREQYLNKGEDIPFIKSVFGRMIRFDLQKGFPLLTTKKVFSRGIIVELLWFLSGSTNIKYLVDNNVHIWDEWAYKAYHKHCLKKNLEEVSQKDFITRIKESNENSKFVKKWADLKMVYGKMWRKWPASDGRKIDQLAWVIDGLRSKPYRKSYVVSAWNPDFIYAMASPGNATEVPPFCHTTFQFATGKTKEGKDKLNLALYQRSADSFLGVPFNIASYALLLEMVAQVVGMEPGEFVHFFGDVHIYSNHMQQVKEQISRVPKPFPQLILNPKIKEVDDFKFEDIKIEHYVSHGPIKADIANIGGFEKTDVKKFRK